MNHLSDQYGIFRLGELRLAVPLDHLKEVMPCTSVEPIPTSAACMPGAVNLRGTMVPLLDPDVLMAVRASPQTHAIVIVVQVEGMLMGLLGDSLEGVLTVAADDMSLLNADNPEPVFLQAAFPHPDGKGFVCLIHIPFLLRVAGIPHIRDRMAGIRLPGMTRDVGRASDRAVRRDQHLMLFSVGRMLLALETSAVMMTLQSPVIEKPLTENPVYQGDMTYDGQRIPTVATGALLGIEHSIQPQCQAFVLRIGDGRVTFLVDHIIDVVSTSMADLPLMPAGMFPAAGFYLGACQTGHLFATAQLQRLGLMEDYFLLLNAEALAGCEALVDLARLGSNSPAEQDKDKRLRRQHGQALVYDAGLRLASQVAGICEILPLQRAIDLFNAPGFARGLVMLRGQPVPIFCLNGLIGQTPPTELTPTSSILVVQKESAYIGFMVPSLVAIGDIIWMRTNPVGGAESVCGQTRIDSRGCWGMIKFDSDDGHETCLSLDLALLAERVLEAGRSRTLDFSWLESLHQNTPLAS